MIRIHRLAVTAVCLLSLTVCVPAGARTKGETARTAYSVKLSRTTIGDESTEWFWFKRPLDLNDDGVPELIVSQLTSRPVIYSYFRGATRIVYQGNGDGAIVAYCPSAGVFAEMSGRMDYYRVWFCTFDGEQTSVLCSYKYKGDPMSFSSQDYIFDNYKVTFYRGNSYTGEKITREEFDELLNTRMNGAAFLPISSTSYLNTEENRADYILNEPTVSEVIPVAQTVDGAENMEEGIRVTWPRSSNADGYVVYRKKEGSISWERAAVIDYSEVTAFIDSAALADELNGTTFRYTVRGYIGDLSCQSRKFDEDGVQVTRLRRPAFIRCEDAPDCMAYASWDKNGSADGYLLQYGTDPDFNEYILEDRGSQKLNNFTFEDLEEGKTYYFRVCSYCRTEDGTCCSAWSTVRSITARK